MAKVRKIHVRPQASALIQPGERGISNGLRVAAYARVSTTLDEQNSSFEAQKDYYEKLITTTPGWTYAGIYADRGISGTSTDHREGFQQLMEDSRAGKIDRILTKSVSRFARNTVDSLNAIRELKALGIGIEFEKEGIFTLDSKGEFLLTIMSSLSQEESRSISENVRWGVKKRMADGKYSVNYSHFLGYKKGPDGRMVVDENEAHIVRFIFRSRLSGYSTTEISKQLMALDVPAPAGGKTWSPSVVNHILSNEKMKGDALLQKSYTKDFLSKKEWECFQRGIIWEYARFHPMNIDERQNVLRWALLGNDIHSNPNGWTDDSGQPMDYLNYLRTDPFLYLERKKAQRGMRQREKPVSFSS